jgi:hypothetical protein
MYVRVASGLENKDKAIWKALLLFRSVKCAKQKK